MQILLIIILLEGKIALLTLKQIYGGLKGNKISDKKLSYLGGI